MRKESPMPEEQEPAGGPTSEQLKHAFKAFRKRLKLTRLDDESKVTRRPVTGGKGSGIVAIAPPAEFPQTVWDELVKQGKLKYAGHGLYELAEV
jgi:hypothetical protein